MELVLGLHRCSHQMTTEACFRWQSRSAAHRLSASAAGTLAHGRRLARSPLHNVVPNSMWAAKAVAWTIRI